MYLVKYKREIDKIITNKYNMLSGLKDKTPYILE